MDDQNYTKELHDAAMAHDFREALKQASKVFVDYGFGEITRMAVHRDTMKVLRAYPGEGDERTAIGIIIDGVKIELE